ncbi:hypothetical protein N9D38_10510, partial [Rubripirellula sp.]|nr:hypothetical protein [Rubripirellula sp.]
MGHPASLKWYAMAPELGDPPIEPNTRSRLTAERDRVKELVPYAVVFPYIKMGRSISGFMVDRTGGKFGPFSDQIFVGDFSLSIVMRATTELVNGVWQGACYPFREGLATGILCCQFTPEGDLLLGGTNRGWPVRGPRQYALQRLDWTGVMPFEIHEITAEPNGFRIRFTKSVDIEIARQRESYRLQTFTHVYQQGYGSPEVDQTIPRVTSVEILADGYEALITVDGLQKGHVHEFDLSGLLSQDGESLLHHQAFYTLNEIPAE